MRDKTQTVVGSPPKEILCLGTVQWGEGLDILWKSLSVLFSVIFGEYIFIFLSLKMKYILKSDFEVKHIIQQEKKKKPNT